MSSRPRRLNRQATVISLMAGATVLVGVTIYAVRSARAHLGDGPISFWTVLLCGLLVVVLPILATAYRLMRRSRAMYAPISVVSVVSGLVVALGAPGNLFLVGLLIVAVASVGFLYLVAWFEFRALHRPLR